jgi:hypothetical protein
MYYASVQNVVDTTRKYHHGYKNIPIRGLDEPFFFLDTDDDDQCELHISSFFVLS